MRIESKLCHVSENKVIVHVTAWVNEENLGSALAEGSTVEEAEDKAISRLNKRINPTSNNDTNTKSVSEDVIKNTLRVDLPRSKKINFNHEPIDWSNELTAIDSEIERLKWSREEEIKFLEKNLGFNNRNKITNYNDIVKYLNLLKKIDISLHSDILNQNIKTLIEESDSLLRDLSWDHTQGREYLQKEFNVSTRKELNEEQLLSFIEKLKILRIQYFSQ